MKVDNGIASAIDQYLADTRQTARQFAQRVGVSEPTLVMWRRPGKGITGKWWQVVFPYIKQYLPKSRMYVGSDGVEHYASADDTTLASFGMDSAVVKVPLLDEHAIRSYMPMAESIQSFADKASLPTAYHINRATGYGGVFAYTLQDEKSGIPSGATIFASTEARPSDGCLVIGVRVTGEVVVGRYHLDDGKVTFAGVTFPAIRLRELFSLFCPILRYEVSCI